MRRLLLRSGALAALIAAFTGPAEARSPVPEPGLAPRADAAGPELAAPFDPGRAGFTTSLRGSLEVDLEVFAVFARPGEEIALTTSTPTRLELEGAHEGAPALNHLLAAPQEPGHFSAALIAADGARMRLNILVMQQAQDGAVDGYRLGDWPAELYRGDPAYTAPTHFVQGSGAFADIELSPHFTLGQFLCKQDAAGERYLVVNERLVAKLEHVLEAANARGWRADSFHVMSGFRTPAYNAAIGNGRFSRHIYGGAADIFIDADGDGWMDDLNGDGRSTRADAALLYDLVEQLSGREDFAPYIGGLGEYGATSWRTPFVHIDERGWRARWGRTATG